MEERKDEQSSMEFDLIKYNKMKISTTDLETLAVIKLVFTMEYFYVVHFCGFCFRKKFLTYKNILKIHFDYSNCLDSTRMQKGCILFMNI